ncbi:MAG: ROK family protein [Candidatus Micrarchaeia archaeon]
MELVGIAISTTELSIAKIDAATKKVEIVYDNHLKLNNRLATSEILKTLDKLGNFSGIGIASTGFLDQNKGIIKRGSAIGIRNYEIANMLEDRYGVPVSLYTLGVANVIAEKLFGIAKEYKNILYVSISSLIRAGVITSNHVLLGAEGQAHQIGHVTVSSEGGLKCSCGSKGGHWNAYCSGYGIPQYVKYLLNTKYKNEKSQLRSMKIDAKTFYSLAKSDKVARRMALEDIGRLNAIGVANGINAYNPEIVILGGVIAKKNPELVLDPIKRNVEKYIVNKKPKIVLSEWQTEGKFLGAVSDFLHSEAKL